MYKYKVLSLKTMSCERTLNKYARDGWQVISMLPSPEDKHKVVVMFERELEEYEDEDEEDYSPKTAAGIVVLNTHRVMYR